MNFPLSTSDITLWLAATAVILLITSEILSNGPLENLAIEIRRFRLAAIAVGLVFLALVAFRTFQLI
jgi:hypothetical protein